MNNENDHVDIESMNLRQLIESYGYVLDKSKGEKPLQFTKGKGSDDHILLNVNEGSKDIFWHRQTKTKGDAMHFLMFMENKSFREIKDMIRGWTPDRYNAPKQVQEEKKKKKPLEFWLAKYARCLTAKDSVYLTKNRKLSPKLLDFCENVRVSSNGTPQFFYRDSDYQLTGCEYRKLNAELTDHIQKTFADAGTTKSIFFLDAAITDFEILVVCEAAIDALSFMQLLINKDVDLNKYLVIGHGGELSTYQCEEIVKVALKGKEQRRVYLAQDNDKAGHDMSERLEKYLIKNNIPCRRKIPALKDWNDVLRAKQHC